jgi:hypothetical protein
MNNWLVSTIPVDSLSRLGSQNMNIGLGKILGNQETIELSRNEVLDLQEHFKIEQSKFEQLLHDQAEIQKVHVLRSH